MEDEQLSNPFNLPHGEEDTGEDILERAMHNVMCTADGRTVVWALLTKSRIYNERFHGTAADTYEKGQRSIGLWMLDLIGRTDPTSYARMLLEVGKIENRRRNLETAGKSKDELHD